MADRIRKIARWIWMNKERMVLVVMLGVLVYQVYQVFNPPEPPQETALRPPSSTVEGLPDDARPPLLPDPPGLLLPGQYANFWRQNPFWVHASGGADAGGDSVVDTVREAIKLVDIMVAGDRTRARLKTRSTSRWYDPGDKFESYTLESIDVSAETVEIFAESAEQMVTIEMSQ